MTSDLGSDDAYSSYSESSSEDAFGPQDSRFKGVCQYDRAKVIKTLTEFYQFLTTLPYVQPEEVLYPPESGWPEITKESLSTLGKNDEVIALLAHMPYICPAGNGKEPPFLGRTGREVMISIHETYLIDYRGERFHAAMEEGKLDDLNYVPRFVDLPDWVVPLTTGEKNGDYLLLDTTDGTVTRHQLAVGSFPPTYDSEDPRAWRDQCDDKTLPVKHYLDELKGRLEQLEFIPCFTEGKTKVFFPLEDQKTADELRSIYTAHGWPDAFRRDECRQALIAYGKDRYI